MAGCMRSKMVLFIHESGRAGVRQILDRAKALKIKDQGPAEEDAAESGSKVRINNDPARAVEYAGIIYTDGRARIGREEDHAEGIKTFARDQVHRVLPEEAKTDTMVMHGLLARRGEEITAEMIEDRRSIVFDEAGNRLHVQKAILALVI